MNAEGRSSRTTSALVSWKWIPAAKGYKVFWGTSTGNYPYQRDVGSALSYRVTELKIGTRYFFAAKAHKAGKESKWSNILGVSTQKIKMIKPQIKIMATEALGAESRRRTIRPEYRAKLEAELQERQASLPDTGTENLFDNSLLKENCE